MMRNLFLALLLLSTPALAQAPQRPTAIQIMAQQLAAAIAQNAELVERNGKLEDQIAQLLKQRDAAPPPPPAPAQPD